MVQPDQKIGDYLGGSCKLCASDDVVNPGLPYGLQQQGVNVSINVPGLKDGGGLRGPFLMAAANVPQPDAVPLQPDQQPAYKTTYNNLA